MRQIEIFNNELKKEREESELVTKSKEELSKLVTDKEKSHEIQKQELIT